ncbi:MAG: PD40 domain-containing protein [Ignavibacteria bacterium]|nr:PD40 domain-containing protein [Ignavibacteria bacterium]
MIVRLISIALCFLVISCRPELRQTITYPCPMPPPPPACNSTDFSTVVFDTSKVINGWRWKISRVLGAETSANEWGLVRVKQNFLLIKGESAATSKQLPVTLKNVNTLDFGWPIGLTETGFVTRVANADITGDASIFETSVAGTNVVIGKPLNDLVNNKIYWDGHSTVSRDGEIIVFASDRPGSLGGTDLWFSNLKNGEWQEPRRLSNDVNTPCDELCPQFAQNDSLLLFSSAGHQTAGGYDVFSSFVTFSGDSILVRAPRNMGLPINTPHDELFPQMTDAQTIYYASNQPKASRTKASDFDLFVLHRVEIKGNVPAKAVIPPPPIVDEPQIVDTPVETLPKEVAVTTPDVDAEMPVVEQRGTIQGTVLHQETHKPVVDAEVTAKHNVSKIVLAKTNTDSAGKYLLSVPVETPVEIVAQSPELFYDNAVVTVPSKKANDTLVLEKPLQLPLTFYLRINFPTSVFDAPYQYTLDSLGVDTDQSWQQSLNQLVENVNLSGKRLKRLVLIGHTDDVSTDASNMKLGRQRVDFVVQELVSRGINEQLLEGRSAGERMLPEKRKNETIDVWRKRARRVELVKVMQ